MSDYEACLNFIIKNSNAENKSYITSDEVDTFITDLDKMLQSGIGHHFIVGLNNEKKSLLPEEKSLLKKDMETRFNISMGNCTVLKGELQAKRDNSWWSDMKNLCNGANYWEMYKNNLNLPPKVKRTIDEDTDLILNNLFNPKENNSDSRYGMVIGHVQSGKTSNYAGLLCKAADAGYKCFIVIAGIHNNLRNQTQKRIKDIFNKINPQNMPIFLTTDEADFNSRDAKKFGTLNFENNKSPIFMVIKKNTNTLKNVLHWISSQYPYQIQTPLLLIDDEADNASINTKEENNPTIINARIRELLSKFSQHAYVGYTATPFANIFIDDEATNDNYGKDLFPEDFIITLDAPSDYFGAQKVFIEENNNIEFVEDFSDYIDSTNKKEIKMDEIPPSLKEAIRCFFINIAIRHLRKQEHKHNSMLIHASRLTDAHRTFAFHVEEYLDNIKRDISLYGLSKTQPSHFLNKMKQTYMNKYNSEFSWDDISNKINEISGTIKVVEAHVKSKDIISYSEDTPQNIIAIGGNSLSRGFTLEGLSVSYFMRNACASDTLMQMARWFGYRHGYQDICKIYLLNSIHDKFISVAESTADLFDNIKDMRNRGKTPKDFGLAVKQHPDSFLITARNKMKNATDIEVEVKLDGYTKESNLISAREEDINNNLEEIKKLIDMLGNAEKQDSNKFLWPNIANQIVHSFVNRLVFLNDYRHLPIESIKSYLSSYPSTLWNIVLIGTNKGLDNENLLYTINENIAIGLQERSVKGPINDFRGFYYELGSRSQVSGALAEKYGLTTDEIEEIKQKTGKEEQNLTRNIIKENMKNPILMIHLLKNKNNINDNIVYPAFTFAFPKSEFDKTHTVKLKVNTVYIKQQQQLELDFGDDYD